VRLTGLRLATRKDLRKVNQTVIVTDSLTAKEKCLCLEMLMATEKGWQKATAK
jgi:hypothetical protein